MAGDGVLEAVVLRASSSGKRLQDGAEYSVCVTFASDLSDKQIETPVCAPSKMKYMKPYDIPLLRKLRAGEKGRVSLVEHHKLFSNVVVAKGYLDLSGLFSAPTQRHVLDVVATSDRGEDVATVQVQVKWKGGNIPDMGTSELDADGPLKSGAPPAAHGNYRVHVRIKRAKNLMSGEEDAVYSPFVKAEVNGKRMETSAVKHTNNPYWNEELTFSFDQVQGDFLSSLIQLQVSHHTLIGMNRVVGQCELDLAKVYCANAEHYLRSKWFVLHSESHFGPVMGFLQASIAVLNVLTDPIPEEDPEEDAVDDEALIAALVAGPGCQFEEVKLVCDVFRAQGIPKMDAGPFDRTDPFVKLGFAGKTTSTFTNEQASDPVWNVSLTLPMFMPSLTGDVVVSLWDWDLVSNDLIASKRLPLQPMIDHRADVIYELETNPPPPWVMRKEKIDRPDGLPHFPAQWVNFYGNPRMCDADLNAWYMQMAKGLREGCDFRGRLLICLDGAPKTTPQRVIDSRMARQPEEISIKVECVVRVGTVAMLPKGKYKLRLSIGTTTAFSDRYECEAMIGDDDAMWYVRFNKELSLSAEFDVVKPRCVDPTVRCENQIPDVFLQLIPVRSLDIMNTDEPIAFTRFDAAQLLRRTTTRPCCVQMTMLKDPSTITAGHEPSTPLAQVECTLRVTGTDPPNAVAVPTWSDAAVPLKLGRVIAENQRYVLGVCVYYAQHIPAGDANGLSDPYLRVSWGNGSGSTGVQRSTLAPCYNELVRVEADVLPDYFPDVVLDIWDWDRIGHDTFLARWVVPFARIQASAGGVFGLQSQDWRDHHGDPVPGCKALLRFDAAPEQGSPPPQMIPFPQEVGSSSTYDGYPIPPDRQLKTALYKVEGNLIGLRCMRPFRLMSLRRPSVEVELVGHRVTIAPMAGPNPSFNKRFSLTVPLPDECKYLPEIVFRVYEHRLGLRSLVGVTSLWLGDPRCDLAHHRELQSDFDAAVDDRLAAILKHKEDAGAGQPLTSRGGSVLEEVNMGEALASPSGRILSPSGGPAGAAMIPNSSFTDAGLDKLTVSVKGASTKVLPRGGDYCIHIDLPAMTVDANTKAFKTSVQNPRKGLLGWNWERTVPMIHSLQGDREEVIRLRLYSYSRSQQRSSARAGPGEKARGAAGTLLGSATVPIGAVRPEAPLTDFEFHVRADRALPEDPPLVSAWISVDWAVAQKYRPRRGPASAAHSPYDELVVDVGADEDGDPAHPLQPPPTDAEATEEAESAANAAEADDPDKALSWYARFDPDDGAAVPAAERVSRLRQMGAVAESTGLCDMPLDQATAEAFFGPFEDYRTLPIHRGWGDNVQRVGDMIANVFVEKLGGLAAKDPLPKVTALPAREACNFTARVYIVGCDALKACDSGALGKSSDPYVKLTLVAGGGSRSEDVVIERKDAVQYQTLAPEFFIVQDICGALPLHSLLRVTLMDHDVVGGNDTIGWTDIDIERRWYSSRGYNSALGRAAMASGGYTEKRTLFDAAGVQGCVEMWVEMYDAAAPLPPPIDIAPPPPIPVELRAVVWNTRDVELVDAAHIDAASTDIYVRAWVNGFENTKQNTDVHYRSVDGSGAFNWRMSWRCTYEPRSKKVFAQSDEGFLSHLLRHRQEPKRHEPLLTVQLFDNDMLPETDDFIGEAQLQLTQLRPTLTRRKKFEAAESCCPWPFSVCASSCCAKNVPVADMLADRQDYAAREAAREVVMRQRKRDALAQRKYTAWLASLRERMDQPSFEPAPAVRIKMLKAFSKAAERAMTVDVFSVFHSHEHGGKAPKEAKPPAEAGSSPQAPATAGTAGVLLDTPKFWFPLRAPNGACRIGDVQLSFQVVRIDDIEKDQTLAAGLGRSEPHALPPPERPESSFFWLSSPGRTAVYIIWGQYKRYIIGALVVTLLVVLALLFGEEVLRIQAQRVMGGLRVKGAGAQAGAWGSSLNSSAAA